VLRLRFGLRLFEIGQPIRFRPGGVKRSDAERRSQQGETEEFHSPPVAERPP
jgi:hypothetical protein